MTDGVYRGGAEAVGVRQCRLELDLRLLDSCVLPGFAGSELRGMLGQGLGTLGRAVDLDDTTHEHPDPFAPGRSSGGGLPPAYALRVDLAGDAGDRPVTWPASARLRVGLELFGPWATAPQRLVDAYTEAGRAGILGRGRDRARFEVENVACAPLETDWLERRVDELSPANALRLHLLTPISLRVSQRTLSWLDPDRLLAAIAARARALEATWGPIFEIAPFIHSSSPSTAGASSVELGTSPFDTPPPLLRVARTTAVSSRAVTYSRLGRQGKRQPLEGVLGEMTFQGHLAPYLPWLALGERIHVGRHASFGFGRYELIPLVEGR
jgi:hypothetical protein